MKNLSFWQKVHKFQEQDGWCGPAVIQTVLMAAGINKTQAEIAKDVYQDWWGTNHDSIVSYLSRYFSDYGVNSNSTISNVSELLDKNYAVIVNWIEDVGHYSLVVAVDSKLQEITLLDPSTDAKGVYSMSIFEFEKKWYDYIDQKEKIKVSGWLFWVDIN